jgi:hypothetical protein
VHQFLLLLHPLHRLAVHEYKVASQQSQASIKLLFIFLLHYSLFLWLLWLLFSCLDSASAIVIVIIMTARCWWRHRHTLASHPPQHGHLSPRHQNKMRTSLPLLQDNVSGLYLPY